MMFLSLIMKEIYVLFIRKLIVNQAVLCEINLNSRLNI